MRLNIYNEELTGSSEIVTKTADTGTTFYGFRFFLLSPDELHHSEEDDDRNAITIWFDEEATAVAMDQRWRQVISAHFLRSAIRTSDAQAKAKEAAKLVDDALVQNEAQEFDAQKWRRIHHGRVRDALNAFWGGEEEFPEESGARMLKFLNDAGLVVYALDDTTPVEEASALVGTWTRPPDAAMPFEPTEDDQKQADTLKETAQSQVVARVADALNEVVPYPKWMGPRTRGEMAGQLFRRLIENGLTLRMGMGDDQSVVMQPDPVNFIAP